LYRRLGFSVEEKTIDVLNDVLEEISVGDKAFVDLLKSSIYFRRTRELI
jgi:hypothetical protein